MPGTSTTTTDTAAARRSRARHAFTLAYARRDGEMRTVGPWILGYLETVASSPMSDREVAETVRGIVEAWREVAADVMAELDANVAAMTGQPLRGADELNVISS